MKKLEIHNFGPTKNVAIEIKPMLVLIGPQASGKSTIAKVIYFFETISDDFFAAYSQSEESEIYLKKYLSTIIKNKFLKYFGLKKSFSLKYWYKQNIYIEILETSGNLKIMFSDSFFDERKNGIILFSYKTNLLNLNKNNLSTNAERQKCLQNIYQETKKIFCNNYDDSLYLIAGRNATVGYSNTFEDTFKQSLFQREITGKQTGDEILMLDFMKRVLQMKDIFIGYDGFDGILSSIQNSLKPKLELLNKLIHNVLRGNYQINNLGEFIMHNDVAVPLNYTSSGQQEAIRILQDAFFGVFQGNNLFRIVEEPEAHLFPEAQKATIELLTLALNNKSENNLIITTHSPYTLTVINNLIYASKVGKKNPQEVEKILPNDLWLPSERVAAYILDNGTAESIIDEELGEIKAEMIDSVSKIVNQEYDQLYDIEYDAEQ